MNTDFKIMNAKDNSWCVVVNFNNGSWRVRAENLLEARRKINALKKIFAENHAYYLQKAVDDLKIWQEVNLNETTNNRH